MQNDEAPVEPEAKERPPVTAVEAKADANTTAVGAVSSAPGEPPAADLVPATAGEPNRPPDIELSRLDADAVRVLVRLRQHGHEAYLVGGCVRDLLLERQPKDFDIATSATPNQVRDLFRNSRLIGRRFRLAHVYFKGGKILEVSTFRANPTTEDPQPSEASEGDVHSEDAADMAAADLDGVVDVEKAALQPDGKDPALESESQAEAELAGFDDDGEGDDDGLDGAGEGRAEGAAGDGADGADGADENDDLPIIEGVEAGPLPSAPVPAASAPPKTPQGQDRSDKQDKDVFIDEDNTFGTAFQDARRRDFTINGLFYDPMAGRVIDYCSGLKDLALRQIRTIGDPEVRLREDPVRILRAVRFASKLDLDIEPRTYAAMEGAVEDLPRCSAPRLLEETFRLIRGGNASKSLKLLRALDALKLLLPPLEDYLRQQDQEGVDEFFAFVTALDARIASGKAFDDSQVLASILLPIALETPEPPPGSDGRLQVAQSIERLLQELVRSSRLPRRIAERCRMVLLAQRTLAGHRRRRGGLASFRRHPLFNEALAVFEVWVLATGELQSELEMWKSGSAPEPSSEAQGPGRRRRRRRRRGGGGPGGQNGSAGSGGSNGHSAES